MFQGVFDVSHVFTITYVYLSLLYVATNYLPICHITLAFNFIYVIIVVTMYVDECRSDKYVRYLLRDSYRQDGKVKHRTIANLSSCSSAEIQAIQIVQESARRWQDLEATVPEGLEELKTLCTIELRIQGHPRCNCILQPRASVQRFLVTVHEGAIGQAGSLHHKEGPLGYAGEAITLACRDSREWLPIL
jgi:hypothetical protein